MKPTATCTWPEFHAPDCECRIFNARANIPPAPHDCVVCGELHTPGEPQAPEPRPAFSKSMQRRVEIQIEGRIRAEYAAKHDALRKILDDLKDIDDRRITRLIVQACFEAWDTPGDALTDFPHQGIPADVRVAEAIARKVMKTEEP